MLQIKDSSPKDSDGIMTRPRSRAGQETVIVINQVCDLFKLLDTKLAGELTDIYIMEQVSS